MIAAEALSDSFTQRRHLRGEVVIDDRMNLTIGRRQVDADRLGYPYTIILGVKVSWLVHHSALIF